MNGQDSVTKPYFKQDMSGKEYFEHQRDASKAFNEPFVVQRPDNVEDLKSLCELCKIEEEGFCCPEHCCDVSSCYDLSKLWINSLFLIPVCAIKY